MVKNLPTNAGDTGLILGSERSPGLGNDNPLQYSCLGNPWIEEPSRLQSMGSQSVWQQYPAPGDADASDCIQGGPLGSAKKIPRTLRDSEVQRMAFCFIAGCWGSSHCKVCRHQTVSECLHTWDGNWEERAETTQRKVCLHGSLLASSCLGFCGYEGLSID